MHIRAIAVLVILGFALTFALEWSHRMPRSALLSSGKGAATTLSPAALPATNPSSPATIQAARTRGGTPAPTTVVPPSEDNGPALPVLFAVSSHPARKQVDDAGAAIGSYGIARQVDVVNNSSDPLAITVVAVDVPTQERTVAELLVPPNAEEHAGSESGLKLAPGYQVTLRSRGYRELTQIVP